jgi:L-aspartate oxidase
MPRPFSTGVTDTTRRAAVPDHPSSGAAPLILNEANRDDLLRSLKSLLWYDVGVERNGEGLTRALEQIRSWAPYCLGAQFSEPAGWILQNMLQTAYLITLAALRREESRGVHFRSDFPERDDKNWKRHSLLSRRILAEGG